MTDEITVSSSADVYFDSDDTSGDLTIGTSATIIVSDGSFLDADDSADAYDLDGIIDSGTDGNEIVDIGTAIQWEYDSPEYFIFDFEGHKIKLTPEEIFIWVPM